MMAGGTWRPNLQSSQFAAFAPVIRLPQPAKTMERTYVARLDNYRSLSTTVFAERGGTAVVTDTAGNIYLASGQV